MNQQGSTPDTNEGANASPQDSADQQSSQSQADLLGDLQPQDNQQDSGAPSQTTGQEESDTVTDDSSDELNQWAGSQGIDLNNPTPEQMRKVAQRLRDTQKWAHDRQQNNQKFNEVQSQLNDDSDSDSDPIERELREIKAQNARRDFWEANADDRQLEGDMIQVVESMVKTGNIEGAKYYSTPSGWKDLLDIVKARKSSDIKDESYEAGRKTERDNLAKAQQASAPPSNAVSSAPTRQKTTDEEIANMSLAEYNEWRKTNNPFRP